MYSVTPKKQNSLDMLACAACFACGVGVFALSIANRSTPYLTLITQLLGVLLLTAGIYLYSKFIARTYTYTIAPGGIYDADGREIYDLVVTETTGKSRQRVVCRITMRDIVRTESRPLRGTKKNGHGKLAPTGSGRVFTYCADMIPQKVLVVHDTDGNVVVLTHDAELARILNRK